jgi:glycerol-3-phosphate dehydrogenase
LIQEWGANSDVAHKLAKTYGGRSSDVLRIARDELEDDFKGGRLLVPGFPYLEAEVVYAVRHEWALFADDILARRTRLAFLNKDLAIGAIPKVVNVSIKRN